MRCSGVILWMGRVALLRVLGEVMVETVPERLVLEVVKEDRLGSRKGDSLREGGYMAGAGVCSIACSKKEAGYQDHHPPMRR